MSTHRFVQRRGVALLLLLLILNVLVANNPRAITYAQDPTEQRLESEAAQVTQTGVWTRQSANQASGGNYLYSSGAETDALTLEFMGTAIEVIYVAGPQLGTLAIEVDGIVLRTVITTSEQTAYQQSTRINYLTDEPHTLNVYAQAGGVIAIDAFVLPIVTPTPTPSPMPTEAAVLAGEQAEGGVQSSICSPKSFLHLVSQSTAGRLGSVASSGPSRLSADGRFVVFSSQASNLVPRDSNGAIDVFVYDRQTCTIQIVSVSSGGNIAMGGDSDIPVISADGRYVAFRSHATNLVPNDTNGVQDTFVHDLRTGIISRVSVGTGSTQSNGVADYLAISADGRYVAFESHGTNLVAGDTNGSRDIFVHDRQANTTTRISVSTGGTQATSNSYFPDISADGRIVTFFSSAANLVPNDTNGVFDTFVHDRTTGITTRVSVGTGGTQGNGESADSAISADGRYITFYSSATNLVPNDTNGFADIFVHDRTTGITTRVSVGTGGTQATGGGSYNTAISADGRYVTFLSSATNLVPNDTNGVQDIFVHDRATVTTTRVSVTSSYGVQANGASYRPGISGDGRYIAFESDATNLVMNDTNGVRDIFVTPILQPGADALALFSPVFKSVGVFDTLTDNPVADHFTAFSAYAPVSGGQWLMGDWDGDGLDTPGIYLNGAFFYTNQFGESAATEWRSLWIGIAGPAVSGRFSEGENDCIGAVQSAQFPPHGLAFAYYYTCDLSGNLTPTISNQFLGVVLPDGGGFSGVHQFGAGDFDGGGLDSLAVRRGPYIAFTNVSPMSGSASFNFAQYIGTPVNSDYGTLIVGNWDSDAYDSFGLFYQSGEFFYRNDLLFNSGAYGNQSVGVPFAGPIQATAWR